MILAERVINVGGKVLPLIIPNIPKSGTGMSSPTIYNHNNKLYAVLRNINFIVFHSEKKKFWHYAGPYHYLKMNDASVMTTENYFVELNSDLSVKSYTVVDTTDIDPPITNQRHVGLEDCRLCLWDNRFYLSGYRYDVSTGGRIELSEIKIENSSVKAVSRFTIPTPNGEQSNCEKNWMPVLDMPFHFIKWTNPTQLVQVDETNKTCTQKKLMNHYNFQTELRGGSQVVRISDFYVAIVHNTNTFFNEHDRFDGNYTHYFIVWDKNWNIVKISKPFKLFNSDIEYAGGMCVYQNSILITIGIQNNAAFILQIPFNRFVEILNE